MLSIISAASFVSDTSFVVAASTIETKMIVVGQSVSLFNGNHQFGRLAAKD